MIKKPRNSVDVVNEVDGSSIRSKRKQLETPRKNKGHVIFMG